MRHIDTQMQCLCPSPFSPVLQTHVSRSLAQSAGRGLSGVHCPFCPPGRLQAAPFALSAKVQLLPAAEQQPLPHAAFTTQYLTPLPPSLMRNQTHVGCLPAHSAGRGVLGVHCPFCPPGKLQPAPFALSVKVQLLPAAEQ
jgi:hypothetical protein